MIDKKIIILGYSEDAKNFQENFELSFIFKGLYHCGDFRLIGINGNVIGVWFAETHCSLYKPVTDVNYENADILIAFGRAKTNIYKYVEQMRRKYCRQALVIFMHNQPKNVIGVLLKKYKIKDFNSFVIRGYFETFFDKLIKHKDQSNHLQVVPYQPQSTYSDIVSSVFVNAGGYVGSFFSDNNSSKDDIANKNKIHKKTQKNKHETSDFEHLGALNLDRLISLEPKNKEDSNTYKGPANIRNLIELSKHFY